MDAESDIEGEPGGLTEADLSAAPLESLVVRHHAARRNAGLARTRADYQDANNTHREAVHYERLIAASERMLQAERKAVVESSPDVLKGRQQAIVLSKEAALWSAEAESIRLYIAARSRVLAMGEPDASLPEGPDPKGS